jgi:hypothetical protein
MSIDDVWSRRSSTVTCIKKSINQHICENQEISTDERASKISIIYGRKQYKNGLRPNQNHLILMELINLWNIGPSALKSRVSNHWVIMLPKLKIKLPLFCRI